ncbi:MAG: phosphoglycolate phosphatase, bacterial [Betaproteobacteria bacterium]|nr:MAG: phosphoglycolate phosphatase, bacterial [Betaproteobacteria bacterium]
MNSRAAPIEVVLFDLDGTLVDTAPDLAAAVNRQRRERGFAELPLEALRPFASHGARGLIGRAFGLAPGEPEYEPLRQEFFRYYEQALCVQSRLFPGMDETLDALEQQGRRWGIVTNKIARFTDPLVAALGLSERAACVVSGDTTAYTKPHPAPLLHALQVCGTAAARAVYVGDDLRDVQAGRAAGVITVVAGYGYMGDGSDGGGWGGDFVIAQPRELLDLSVLKG